MRDLNIVPVNLEHVPVCVANFEGLTEEVCCVCIDMDLSDPVSW